MKRYAHPAILALMAVLSAVSGCEVVVSQPRDSASAQELTPPAKDDGQPADLPGLPTLAEARDELADLAVGPERSSADYDRELFPHWSYQGDGCDTRDLVLQRDGERISDGDGCSITGRWYSVYDGESWTDTGDVDVDHVVALAEAWASGASEWTTDEREAFANDLEQPQLIAVTDNVNQEKSDQDPAEWLPPLTDYHCTYARAWTHVKHHYDLAVDEAELAALNDILSGCST
jgi:hypothetical protein